MLFLEHDSPFCENQKDWKYRKLCLGKNIDKKF